MIRNKKILVTGATGAVARAIAADLAPNNEVWAIARFSDPEARRKLEAQGIRTFAWTLGEDAFDGLPQEYDHVIHSAASIFDVKDDYSAAIRANAEGTGLLLGHVRGSGSLLHVSTAQVYKEVTDKSVGRKEDEPLGSHPNYAPSYSISKISTEAVVRTMCRLFKLPTTIARHQTNFGPGAHQLVDRAVDDLISGKPVTVPPRGVKWVGLIYNPDAVRQVEPLLAAASIPATIVNWGVDEGVEWRQLLDFIAQMIGVEPEYVEDPEAGPVAGWADPTKRIAITGPASPWKEAIRTTIAANFPQLTLRP